MHPDKWPEETIKSPARSQQELLDVVRSVDRRDRFKSFWQIFWFCAIVLGLFVAFAVFSMMQGPDYLYRNG